MGSDDLHHKRKTRAARDLKRKVALRESYDKVLIVCEGKKTEPLYFSELVKTFKINSANIAIDLESDSAPISIYERAKELYDAELRKSIPYDKVFCVFDRDTHSTFNDALQKINTFKPENIFIAITSTPCFEYWLLLHYLPTSKPYMPCGKKTSADYVISDLKNYMNNYKKNQCGIFTDLFGQLEFASGNAIRMYGNDFKEFQHGNNPSTNVHIIVEYLKNIKK